MTLSGSPYSSLLHDPLIGIWPPVASTHPSAAAWCTPRLWPSSWAMMRMSDGRALTHVYLPGMAPSPPHGHALSRGVTNMTWSYSCRSTPAARVASQPW